MPNLEKIGENIFKNCFALKSGEKVLVLTDEKKIKEANFFFAAAKKFTNQARLVEIPVLQLSGQEPPAETLKALLWADIALLVTSQSLSHTAARQKASLAGVRIASLPAITFDIIERSLDVDYQQIIRDSNKIAEILTSGEVAEIKSGKGTNLKIKIKNRKAVAETGLFLKSGAFGNLPSGEAFIAPREGKAEGVAVIDGNAFLPGLGLDEPIRITFRWGRAWRIKGGLAAEILKKKLKEIPGSNKLAELGIGTNPRASLLSAEVGPLEIEKVFGTVHLALGSNFTFGGRINVGFHADGVILRPNLKIDGKTIIENGELLV